MQTNLKDLWLEKDLIQILAVVFQQLLNHIWWWTSIDDGDNIC